MASSEKKTGKSHSPLLAAPEANRIAEPGLGAARREKAQAVAHEKRRHPRFDFRLPVGFLFPDNSGDTGELLDISVGGLALSTDMHPDLRSEVAFYIGELGRFEGHVVRLFENGFAAEFVLSERKREWTGEILNWFAAGKVGELQDERRHKRADVGQTSSELTLENGMAVPYRLVNISLGGMALELENPPEVGQTVRFGQTVGRVVRRSGRRVGVQFVYPSR